MHVILIFFHFCISLLLQLQLKSDYNYVNTKGKQYVDFKFHVGFWFLLSSVVAVVVAVLCIPFSYYWLDCCFVSISIESCRTLSELYDRNTQLGWHFYGAQDFWLLVFFLSTFFAFLVPFVLSVLCGMCHLYIFRLLEY